MDQETFVKFSKYTSPPVKILDINDIIALLEKVKPEWTQITGEANGLVGPIYSCMIEIKDWNLKLELAVGQFSKSGVALRRFRDEPVKFEYQPNEWILIAVEGDKLMTFLKESAPDKRQHLIKELFAKVDTVFKQKALRVAGPSAERTNAAVKLFLEGKIS